MDRNRPLHHQLTSNSPSQDRATQSAYLSALRQIDRIPVPDLASTLSTAANDEDIDTAAENTLLIPEPPTSYLRTQIDARSSFASASTDDFTDDFEAYLLPEDNVSNSATALPSHSLSTTTTTSPPLPPPPPPPPQIDRSQRSDILESHRQRITRLTDTWRNTMEERDARLDRLERVLAQLNRVHGGDALIDSSHRSSTPSTTQQDTSSWTSAVDPQMERRLAQRQAELDRIRRESHARDAELQRIQRETRDVMRMFANRSELNAAQHQGSDDLSRQSSAQAQAQAHAQHQAQAQAQAQAHALLMQQQQARLQSIQERSLRTSALRAGASVTQHADRMARQDGRRHPRFWARHRELLARSGETADTPMNVDSGVNTEAYNSRPQSRTRQSNLESGMHPGYRQPSQDASAETSSESLMLQDSMVYLSNLRRYTSRDDAVSFALQAAFAYKDFANSNFISDLDQLLPPAPTSLMAPGAMFKGAQFSSSPSSDSTTTRNRHSSTSSMYQLPHPLSANSDSEDSFHSLMADAAALRTQRASRASSPHNAGQSDSWPVKVSIYDVDYERMTLSASMEAYDVPSSTNTASPVSAARSSGTIHKPITTYLEGEILDFKRNTFITESFASTISRDSKYWNKLPPFNEYNASDLSARLLERDYLMKVNSEYILMRWKERCFVSHTPGGSLSQRSANGGAVWRSATDDSLEGCNLTISGFYYVSLRRVDGSIEGLYCDPQSSPFQFLKLNRVKSSAFPSWSFK